VQQLITGVYFECQGYEPEGIEFYAKIYGAKNLISGRDKRMRRFTYEYDGKTRRYRPDIYIPKENLIVEVKSTATLGLLKTNKFGDGEYLWKRMKAKAIACLSRGFRFKLLLYADHKTQLNLPNTWINMSRLEVLNLLNL
jgi:hypothetical protein